MQVVLAACRKPAGSCNTLFEMLYVFEHKTLDLLIHAPYTRIVVFWHISYMPPWISWDQICYNTPMFCIATILLYNCQLVVIMKEPIYVVQAVRH